MPTISMFYGIIIRMFCFDDERHHEPHVHVEAGGDYAVYSILNGMPLAGSLPVSRHRLVQAWIELRREELQADWTLATAGEVPFRIDPLR